MASLAAERYLEYIKAKFLRTEGRTHLHVTTEDAPNEGLLVSWTFTFDDLGLFHTLSSTSLLEMPDLFGPVLVDGMPFHDIEEAEEAVFGGGRFDAYVRELYAQVLPRCVT